MKTQRIELNSKDRFILNGLDDDCFIIAKSMEIGTDVNIPIIIAGDVFQIDKENGKVTHIGERNIQLSCTFDATWSEDIKRPGHEYMYD